MFRNPRTARSSAQAANQLEELARIDQYWLDRYQELVTDGKIAGSVVPVNATRASVIVQAYDWQIKTPGA